MGALKWTATLEPRGPAAAVILDDEQETRDRRVARAIEMLHAGDTLS